MTIVSKPFFLLYHINILQNKYYTPAFKPGYNISNNVAIAKILYNWQQIPSLNYQFYILNLLFFIL